MRRIQFTTRRAVSGIVVRLDAAGYTTLMLKDSRTLAGHDAPAQELSLPPRPRKGGASRAPERSPQPLGWSTTDDDEIALRRRRGSAEITALEALDPRQPVFGTFKIRSDGGSTYDVEIRSLSQRPLRPVDP